MAKINYSTQYQLSYINLLAPSTNNPLSLKDYLVELNYYEDLFSSTISGQVVLNDSISLLTNYMISGTEFIEIGFRKFNSDTDILHKVFRVYKVSNRKIDPSQLTQSYVLYFCSEEFLLSEQYRISKSFKGKKISDIVTSVLQDNLKIGKGNTKKINVEETIGAYDFILPNKKIFETISWLSSYARPKSGNPGSDMVFFENSLGYQFFSLQTLYQQDVYDTYNFKPKNVSYETQDKIKDILTFEVIDQFDVLDGMSKGSFSNRLISLDPLLRKVRTTDFNYNDYIVNKGGKLLNSYPVVSPYKNRFGQYIFESSDVSKTGMQSGVLRMSASNANEKKVVSKPAAVAEDIYIETYVPNRVAQMALANYMKIRIMVPGNAELTVGTTLNINAYDMLIQKGQRELDKYLSGKYLVTAVRHMLKTQDATHYTVVELVKDSLSGPLSTPTEGVNWKNAVNGIDPNV